MKSELFSLSTEKQDRFIFVTGEDTPAGLKANLLYRMKAQGRLSGDGKNL